jgi:hypothetical protein
VASLARVPVPVPVRALELELELELEKAKGLEPEKALGLVTAREPVPV